MKQEVVLNEKIGTLQNIFDDLKNQNKSKIDFLKLKIKKLFVPIVLIKLSVIGGSLNKMLKYFIKIYYLFFYLLCLCLVLLKCLPIKREQTMLYL